MKINSERLILQEISMDDLNDTHRLNSFPEVDEYNTLGIPKSIEETAEIIRQQIEEQVKRPQKSYTWKICLKDSGEYIGLAGMKLSLDMFKLGDISYKLIPLYWNRGYATEVAKALIKTGFENFQLHKVEAGTATENTCSIRVLEKSGMTREGLRRKILPIRGEWKDNYHYAIVADDARDY